MGEMQEIDIKKLTLANVEKNIENGDYGTAIDSLYRLQGEHHALRARIKYHQGNYPEALAEAKIAGEDSETALITQLNIYQYADEYRDPIKAKELLEKIGPTVSSLNSEVIAALKPDSDADFSDLLRRGEEVTLGLTAENATLVSSHLMHNLARLAMDKLNNLPKALELINQAIETYGTETHLHHRAAANFWKTKISEKQGNIDQAIEAAKESVRLWKTQVVINPEPAFITKSENALNRLAELRELKKN